MPQLNIRIRAGSDDTKTQQIFNQIASAILAGKVEPGESISSERAMAERLGVSRNIVRNAYRRLEEQGLVETVSTAGRRVRASKKKRASNPSGGVERKDSLAARKQGARGRMK
ncbi:MAG: winged helix-turn-helix domain-containing protein [Pyrinomonadaceae bacterium]